MDNSSRSKTSDDGDQSSYRNIGNNMDSKDNGNSAIIESDESSNVSYSSHSYNDDEGNYEEDDDESNSETISFDKNADDDDNDSKLKEKEGDVQKLVVDIGSNTQYDDDRVKQKHDYDPREIREIHSKENVELELLDRFISYSDSCDDDRHGEAININDDEGLSYSSPVASPQGAIVNTENAAQLVNLSTNPRSSFSDSLSRETDEIILPTMAKGATQLVGLFEDPNNNDNEDNKVNKRSAQSSLLQQKKPSLSTPERAKQLVGLFEDPKNNDNEENNVNNSSSQTNCLQQMLSSPSTPKRATQLVGLFEDPNAYDDNMCTSSAPSIAPMSSKRPDLTRELTQRTVNFRGTSLNNVFQRDTAENDSSHETDHLLHNFKLQTSYTPKQQHEPTLEAIFKDPSNDDSKFTSNHYNYKETSNQDKQSQKSSCSCPTLPKKEAVLNAVIGSLIFGLFHIVFCLAQASAITRPYSHKPIIGPMVRVASIGTIATTPFFLKFMLKSFPDVYPSIDIFPVPFYAQQVRIIDDILTQSGLETDDNLFLTTFCVTQGIGLFLTSLLLVGATKFKLANLGAFLPYPVMAGFFATVGLLIWTLAFSIDTGGKHVHAVFIENFNDLNQMKKAIIHHVGSIVVAVIMKRVRAVNTSLVPIITVLTVPVSYVIMFLKGISFEEARERGWFWDKSSFHTENQQQWAPPLPFGVVVSALNGNVYWVAVWKCLPVTIAMALIYFIRCSLHAPALKKSTENIFKWREEQEKNIGSGSSNDFSFNASLRRRFSEYEDDFLYEPENVKPPEKMGMPTVYCIYGKMLTLSCLVGGSAVVPSLGPTSTISQLGISGASPQYGSAIVLLAFYLTDFQLVGYIPKVTFSSLLVLTAFAMIEDWFLKSYQKVKQKAEWGVVPLIIFFSFTVGALQAVFIGIAISTFIFVGSFYRSGVVKYIANGLTVQSTTERSPDDTKWLDLHGDLIQLVVLQNYLFFGNAYSCLNYIATMFEEPSPDDLEATDFELPPIPKYLIIDFTLISGMDVSAVDVFSDIISLCRDNSCRVFLSGLRPDLESIFGCGGVKPSRKKNSLYYMLSFHDSMDTALRRAEDALIVKVLKDEEKEMRRRAGSVHISVEDGFMNALMHIDSQHRMNVTSKLMALSDYTSVVDLQMGESLSDLGSLYFIEHGILKVERDAANTTRAMRKKTDGSTKMMLYATPRVTDSTSSLSNLRVRTKTIGREAALLKNHRKINDQSYTVRLARIGPGFVIGCLEVCTSAFNYHQGVYTAVTPCRLHCLSSGSIEEIEELHPRLALELYKMLSQLSAERQAASIDRWATLQSIMVSFAPSKPVDRITMAAIQKAMNQM